MLYQRDFDHWSSPILSESCWGKLLQAERLEGGVCGDRDCTFLEFLTESFLLFLPTLPTLPDHPDAIKVGNNQCNALQWKGEEWIFWRWFIWFVLFLSGHVQHRFDHRALLGDRHNCHDWMISTQYISIAKAHLYHLSNIVSNSRSNEVSPRNLSENWHEFPNFGNQDMPTWGTFLTYSIDIRIGIKRAVSKC